MNVSHVSLCVVQLLHAVPLEPHAVSTVPARHVFVASQQPSQVSLHGHTPPLPPNCVWQLLLLSQQPVGHVFGPQVKPEQIPSSQKPVEGQVLHKKPSKPHAALVVPGWQTPCASQHPLGHVVSLQLVSWQLPPWHCDVSSHDCHD